MTVLVEPDFHLRNARNKSAPRATSAAIPAATNSQVGALLAPPEPPTITPPVLISPPWTPELAEPLMPTVIGGMVLPPNRDDQHGRDRDESDYGAANQPGRDCGELLVGVVAAKDGVGGRLRLNALTAAAAAAHAAE